MTDPRVRASDKDRQQVVAALGTHTAAGRLTLDEYAQRVDRVLTARTHGELDLLVADLPVERPPSAEQRYLLWAFLVAALVVAGFAVALSLAR